MRGYQALRETAAWLDLGGRGLIRATGEDRARLLHAMTTNHVQQLAPGQGCYAFFLNAQGRILGDVNLLCRGQDFLLDTEPETREKLYAHLDRYIIADDVTLEDLTPSMTALAVEGPDADQAARVLGVPLPEEPYAFREWGTRMAARLSFTGAPGWRLLAPAAEKPGLIGMLETAGLPGAGPEAARVVRFEHGRPRYGDEITEAQLPQETRLTHALHFSKGCYLGQEIVERVRSRGHVNRLLTRLEVDAAQAPAAGVPVLSRDREAGAVLTAVFSPGLGKALAFAYLRAELLTPGAAFTIAGAPARAL